MAAKEETIYLYGKHALREALIARPSVIKKVFLDENAMADRDITDILAKNNITPGKLKGTDVGLSKDAVHQGVIALLKNENLYTPMSVVDEIFKAKQNPLFVLLDELHDPHNVGAIIRSAVAFGASAIFMPEHNQSPITGTVIKTSVGMAFRIPIIQIGNVNQTIRALKDKGVWVYGLVMDGDTILKNAEFDTPTLIVVGNESDGIRQKTLELCDIKLSIPMNPDCESLNASIATSTVLYEWSRGNL